ncbi:hypothetical protein [Sphingorhabdus sp. Alg239-R122]|uniref:hypothetical protein n=1 Tax=Sphingorhabdus sp. Alg239-R122 TaxID=2305989 RepID=UPI001F07F7A9|nr:hypothetical protein [Sphingorhabdus sp. Alg239-R122]
MAEKMSPQIKRYLKRIAILMVLYLIFLFSADYLIDNEMVSGAPAYILALLAGLPVAGMFWAIGMLLIEETDEFLRMLLVRQTLIATGIAMAAASIWGFLENFGLAPHVDSYWWAIIWFGGLGVGALVNKLTLGAAGPG